MFTWYITVKITSDLKKCLSWCFFIIGDQQWRFIIYVCDFFAYLNDCLASLIMQLSFATLLDFYNHFTKFTDLVDTKGKCV